MWPSIETSNTDARNISLCTMASHIRAVSSNGKHLLSYKTLLKKRYLKLPLIVLLGLFIIALTKHRQNELLNVMHNNFFQDEYLSTSI